MYAVNDIPLIDINQSATGCCTLISPDEWDGQTLTFKDKLFAKTHTRSIFHIPLDMHRVMKDAQAKIEAAGAATPQWLILSREASAWHADHYFAVAKDVPGLESAQISGTFVTKVFEGPYQDARKWHEELTKYATSLGNTPTAIYFFYTTCPKCAKIYGKNYVIGFAQIK